MTSQQHDPALELSDQSLPTIRSLRRSRWDEIISIRDDGTEEHWRFDRSVVPHGRPPPHPDDPPAVWCEWPIESQYREGTCSRSAAPNRYGLALCWQHEDAAFSHVYNKIEQGAYYGQRIESLTNALFRSIYTTTFGTTLNVGAAAATQAADNVIRSRLADIIENDAAFEPDWRLDTLLDTLLEKRLHEKWGSEYD